MIAINCGKCHTRLAEPPFLLGEDEPCPACGSTVRCVEQQFLSGETVTRAVLWRRLLMRVLNRTWPLAVIVLLAAWAAPAGVGHRLGIGEWGRLLSVILVGPLVQLAGLVLGARSVRNRLWDHALPVGRSLMLGEATTLEGLQRSLLAEVENEARRASEAEFRLVALINDLTRAPATLFVAGLVIEVWAGVWGLVRGG